MGWSQHKEIKLEDFKLKSGEIVNVLCSVRFDYERDYNYGADADGNRGIVSDFVVGYEIEGVYDLETGDERDDLKKDSDLICKVEKEM